MTEEGKVVNLDRVELRLDTKTLIDQIGRIPTTALRSGCRSRV
jgi:hypothetical protein